MVEMFIGNIERSVTEGDLITFFARHRMKFEKLRLIRNKETAKSRGFGFISFPDEHDAKELENYFKGLTLKGQELTIRKAKKLQFDMQETA